MKIIYTCMENNWITNEKELSLKRTKEKCDILLKNQQKEFYKEDLKFIIYLEIDSNFVNDKLDSSLWKIKIFIFYLTFKWVSKMGLLHQKLFTKFFDKSSDT